ncbi:MAG: pyruvate/2-oxoacid:ferredoxin oxidoreductase alpha subunit/pyruvate/2-oxoacid:ferredoxin oxidoreductase beta subunit [Cyclobacteriaceae bacterium]|jgi:pyruvate/2-oxoacid:ferredoxin oxidoreductase alpha subunit/pyruvate/2-oxoacid:ferredoxin oxidoreductase beta subunit/Pyruvate/2-oxoacid:ferredoxin oxidoreductase gamma subunit
MENSQFVTTDGNTAASNIAYAFSEVAAIYPITPSSDMGEKADAWSAAGKTNLFGETVDVIQMQSEAGAAGAIHGALSGGAMATTFTASQGLLLMIPNMFKIAGEMLPTVFHVSARSIAAQALSIFGDHSDVMITRGTGFALLASNNVQEAQDMAAIAHLSTLKSKIPFLHFFDGFRTSHSVQKIVSLPYESIKEMLEMKYVEEFRNGALRPEHPVCKVGAQNSDVYFQGRETVNQYYTDCPAIVQGYMDLFFEKTGRKYELFEYVGDPKAEKVIIAMGSSTETIEETVNFLVNRGEKVGVLKVRLYRPFSIEAFIDKIPKSVKKIAVLDRTKEPGAPGEPLYLDILSAFKGRSDVHIIGGRYGLSSKEFTPSMVNAVFQHVENGGWHDFTVGINDDVTHLSIPVKEELETEQKGIIRCKFWGYGSDGTVSANKNAIMIIGQSTDQYVQGYFQYDSNKSGGYTVSHLRFGKEKIQSEYLLNKAEFIALHRPQYIGKYDILEGITEGGTFLINSSQQPDRIFDLFTAEMQQTIRAKKIKVFAIDAAKIAKSVGLGGRINSVMQTAFFKLSGVLPEKEAIGLIKKYIEKQFMRKGPEIVEMNWKAIDASSEAIVEVAIPKIKKDEKNASIQEVVPAGSGDFAEKLMDPVLRLKGDMIPVSMMSINGTIPTATKKLENRGRPGNPAKWAAKYDFVPEFNQEEPYFEYPGCCSGCGETPYIHLATQLFGDRMIIANATGCTSIYGGTFPSTPYSVDSKGRGPAWANSLFEDNAEYGFGMRLALDANRKQLKSNIEIYLKNHPSTKLGKALKTSLELWKEVTTLAKAHADDVKELVTVEIKGADEKMKPVLAKIIELQDYLVDKSIWIIGGDGWAYDIGFSGLDHVMASDKNVNLLVLDTEVYSNTGGQSSKATPRGAVAKFASDGKKLGKKNLGLMMTTYGNAYVASVNMGMDREQTLRAIVEAEQHNGPSLIIAYSPCIAHGYSMQLAKKQSEKASKSGYWPMYRFNPELKNQNLSPFTWDSPELDTDFEKYVEEEIRYKTLKRSNPEEAERLIGLAKDDNARRFQDLKHLSDETEPVAPIENPLTEPVHD